MLGFGLLLHLLQLLVDGGLFHFLQVLCGKLPESHRGDVGIPALEEHRIAGDLAGVVLHQLPEGLLAVVQFGLAAGHSFLHLVQHLFHGLLQHPGGELCGLHAEGNGALDDFFLHKTSSPFRRRWLCITRFRLKAKSLFAPQLLLSLQNSVLRGPNLPYRS